MYAATESGDVLRGTQSMLMSGPGKQGESREKEDEELKCFLFS